MHVFLQATNLALNLVCDYNISTLSYPEENAIDIYWPVPATYTQPGPAVWSG